MAGVYYRNKLDGHIRAITWRCGSNSQRSELKEHPDWERLNPEDAGKERQQGAIVVAFIRDPWDRLRSAWRRQYDRHGVEFEDYINKQYAIDDHHVIPQTRVHEVCPPTIWLPFEELPLHCSLHLNTTGGVLPKHINPEFSLWVHETFKQDFLTYDRAVRASREGRQGPLPEGYKR